MRDAHDTWQYRFLPPVTILGTNTEWVQVKAGAGQLNVCWVFDDLAGEMYDVWDGILGARDTSVPGAPPSLSGRILFLRKFGVIGPGCITFDLGLVVVYAANAINSGFVAYR